MALQVPLFITETEDELRLAGVDESYVDNLKADIRDITNIPDRTLGAPHNTFEKIDRAVRRTAQEMTRIDPAIRDKMREFAIRYHAYVTDHKAVITADEFKKDLMLALHGIPEIEAIYLANKIITAVRNTKKVSAEEIYREVLSLIRKNPKNTKNANIFHTIVDLYIDKLLSDGTIEQDENAKAWTSLDQLARIFTTDKEFLYRTKPETLSRKGKVIQQAIQTIVKGIQTRQTNTIRKGIQENFIGTDDIGIIIDQYLWEIEQRIH